MVRYSDELIDDIKSKNDIIDIISQYVTLKRSGRNYFGLCPFHNEKSPSFSVSPDKQIFHCFGCNVGGDVFRFISKIENTSFPEAVEMLAERAGIEVPSYDSDGDSEIAKLKSKVYEINQIASEFYHENLYKPTAKKAQEYVKKRKLDNATLKNFLIGYSPLNNELYATLKEKGFTEKEILSSNLVYKTQDGKFIDRFRGRLMFPIQDVRNRVIAFGGRVLMEEEERKKLEESGKKTPKYINSQEGIVYSKGRNLYGLNVAKKYESKMKKIIIVEGYMDAISLHQRGIHNVVASLGTALTEGQGHLLRNNSEQVIIGYDSDGAGQAATMRGLEILQNMGCDIRILQIEGAKDPDEFVIKYGPERFLKYVDNSISLVEFKIKNLRVNLDIEQANDKIKFLKEIANVLTKIDNEIEKEVYIEKISLEYKIPKEAIYAEISKLENKNAVSSKKVLEKAKPKIEIKENTKELDDQKLKREKLIIYLLINYPEESFFRISNSISYSDIKDETNKNIIKKLYEELEKGNSNINHILNCFQDDENIMNEISWIMAYDFEITEVSKCIDDIINTYKRDRLISERNEIIKSLENESLSTEERENLEIGLNEIIMRLAKIK
ncbi:MAG: DNA primase [Clostridia bacterium]|nr:DNA primase [Clostridia bacterium]